MVDQLMPAEEPDSSAAYQKSTVKKLCRFSVSHMAGALRMARPNTSSSVAAPQMSVM